MKKDDLDFLFHLLAPLSPTGFEMPGQQVWADRIRSHAPEARMPRPRAAKPKP